MDKQTDPAVEQVATITTTINGEERSSTVPTRMLLSDYIRHEVGLTGTHVGCEHGVCGCCTVMIDGVSARSCLAFAVQCDGAEIQTVESLTNADDALSPLQQAFHECHALQCGFCTPGFLMAITEFLEREKRADLTEEEVRKAISGNLCRCTGYTNIVDAVQLTAQRLYGKGN
jgi:aerobic-type carbon monoxide dehydrogenase small subunit (CoxS/CutS family)